MLYKRQILSFIIFVSLSFIFSACSFIQTKSSDTPPNASLINTYWKLMQINGKIVELTNKREAYMVLNENKIRGNSGCNSMNGVYSFKEDKLSLSRPMMMTRMFCQGSVEGEFTKALAQMKTYKIKGQSLEIFDANGLKLAEFKSVYLH